jgi:hypothetical protein
MNEQSTHLVRAIQGPVILITIGVLFAFDRFTEFRFSQTWPILLIVVGLVKLVGGGRRGFRRSDYNGPDYSAAGVPPQAPPPPQPPPPYRDPGGGVSQGSPRP